MEPGGDATFSVINGLTGGNGFWGTVIGGSTTTLKVHGNHKRSITFPSSAGNNFMVTQPGIMADSGSRSSIYFLFDTIPNGNLKINPIEVSQSGGSTCFGITVNTSGQLAIYDKTFAIQATGSTILSTNTWYRISVTYTITNGTTNSINVYLNGLSEIVASNISVNTTSSILAFGFTETAYGGAGVNMYYSDFYVDNGSSGDTGNIWVTAKRPLSNGTLNQWITQVGTFGSGYGTGHAPQVNERPLSTVNAWSITSASLQVEEYTIESKSQGDFDISFTSIIDYTGWVSTKVGSASTGNIIVAGVATNIAVLTTNGIFTKAAGSSTYPTGNTDIGMDTNAVNQLFTLNECGILVAFIPPVQPTITGINTITGAQSITF